MNIPTAELEGFAEADERRPKTVLYPRDPSLDPQLVWKGKDEQDQADLAVPSVPIYIQEHISPKAIIEDLRASTAAGREQQLDLFSDFNGMAFDQRVDFYQHPMKWSNRMILGDSLLVMTSLAEKEGLKGQVQMIYLDPPYGIKFGSNWQVSTRKRDVKDGKAEDATRQPEQVRAFRDTWELGIHSYLSYLRDRLVVARELLTESGSIFVQMSDENLHLVRSLLDEVFGAKNFVSVITFATTSGFESIELARGGDYLLWYAKDRERGTKVRDLFEPALREPGVAGYRWVALPDGAMRALTARELRGEDPFPIGAALYNPDNLISQGAASTRQVFTFRGKDYTPGPNSHWKAQFPEGMSRLAWANRIHVSANSIRYVRMADDSGWRTRNNIWTDTLTGQFTEEKVYAVQTNTKVIERCLLMATDPGDLVLDPTCGSGTTAYVAEQWGRRWITIDTSRVALALARTRLMSARYPYYLLADSPEGQRREAELTGQPPIGSTEGDIRKGFVYERVPHVTLKSIAQNPDIREGTTREEIDAAIARHAETEILFDRPYEDRKVVRVAGPFTVESLSPHRVVADSPEDFAGEPAAPVEESGRFVEMVLANLRKSGVDNRFRGERLRFESLETYPGRYLQATGSYLEGGASKRVAVAIGPEYGTVGPELVREAVVETSGYFDVLVVCGFAFDAQADEETTKAQRFGKLVVLNARMNPDLAIGDELLKKTGAGNLFTVFGQPDVSIRPAEDGGLQVEVRGLDVYDPTTGQVRSSRADEDIACWFIDTDYNGRSFFVRHAYFCGDDEPYDKLRRALRAEIDEAAWASLYSTVSRPFPRPSSGRIAVKVINHYGDEILKVYEA